MDSILATCVENDVTFITIKFHKFKVEEYKADETSPMSVVGDVTLCEVLISQPVLKTK